MAEIVRAACRSGGDGSETQQPVGRQGNSRSPVDRIGGADYRQVERTRRGQSGPPRARNRAGSPPTPTRSGTWRTTPSASAGSERAPMPWPSRPGRTGADRAGALHSSSSDGEPRMTTGTWGSELVPFRVQHEAEDERKLTYRLRQERSPSVDWSAHARVAAGDAAVIMLGKEDVDGRDRRFGGGNRLNQRAPSWRAATATVRPLRASGDRCPRRGHASAAVVGRAAGTIDRRQARDRKRFRENRRASCFGSHRPAASSTASVTAPAATGSLLQRRNDSCHSGRFSSAGECAQLPRVQAESAPRPVER